MKTKNFFILVACIVASSCVVWLLSAPTPNIRSFMSETHRHIKNLNSNIQGKFREDYKDGKLEVDNTYLELLGFVPNAKLYPNESDPADEDSFPVVTIFRNVDGKELSFIDSKLKFLPHKKLLIYDLGLSSSDLLKIRKKCNVTCAIRTFNFAKYPSHVDDSRLKAYKPIIIQEVLIEFGALIFAEPSKEFIRGDIGELVSKARKFGLVAWELEEPVSAFTHPKMFAFFDAPQDKYYFLHMVDNSQMILFNTGLVHNRLMLPWVKCMLKEDCVAPPGAQSSGCNLNRRPRFLYSGCHRYEMSAFNVILGPMFSFDSQWYSTRERLFDAPSARSHRDRNESHVSSGRS